MDEFAGDTGAPWSARSREADHDAGVLDVDVERPNFARMTNYLLGGGAHFAVDRAAVDHLLDRDPAIAERIRRARGFVARALHTALARGHDQFLDLGSGIPSVGGVHALVHASSPASRVVYVDVDPVAVAHTREVLAESGALGATGVVRADLRDVGAVLDDPEVRDRIDLGRPLTITCHAVLQWVPDDAAALRDVFTAYRRACAPGSLLVIGVAHLDDLGPADRDTAVTTMERTVGLATAHSRADVVTMFTGWDQLDPGVVDVVDWPTPSGQDRQGFYGAVGVAGP